MIREIFIVCILPAVFCLNPGFRVHVTDAGIDYVKYFMITELNRYLPGKKFPDIHFKNTREGTEKSLRDGSVNNIILTTFNVPPEMSFITTIPDRGLNWEASRIVLRVDMSYKQSIFKGDITATASTSKLGVTAKLAATPTGQPSLQDVICKFDIGNLDLDFHGTFSSFFIDWFHKIIEDKVREEINKAVCDAVQLLIVKGNEQLEKLTMKFDIGDHLTLDYAFIGSPVYGSTNFIDLNLRGEFYSDSVHFPDARPELADLRQSAPMVYMQVSEYMFNSLAYSMQEQGLLKLHIDQALVDQVAPPKLPPFFMNVTCPKICLGKFIPLIGMSFTGGSIFIDFVSTSAPKFQVSKSAATFDMTGSIQFKVLQDNGTCADAFDMSVTVEAKLYDIMLEGDRFTATTNITETTSKVESSQIGEVNEEALQNFWNLIINKVISPLLNNVTHSGFPLPAIPGVKFIDPAINSEDHAFLMRADLSIMDTR